MCTGDLIADHSKGLKHDITVTAVSVLLELSAADNLEQFRSLVEQEGLHVNESGLWYGRTLGSKKMKLGERTPLMIASMFGSNQVLNFILGLKGVDVNKCCGSDRATAMHLAVAGGSTSCVEVVKLLIDSSADTNCLDVHGNWPVDLIPFAFGSSFNSRRKLLELVLNGYSDDQELLVLNDLSDNLVEEQKVSPILIKKEYPVDLSLPDMKNGIYNTDEFRMYAFKIKPCSRAYSHDWTECPFVHPGETLEDATHESIITAAYHAPSFVKDHAGKEIIANTLTGSLSVGFILRNIVPVYAKMKLGAVEKYVSLRINPMNFDLYTRPPALPYFRLDRYTMFHQLVPFLLAPRQS